MPSKTRVTRNAKSSKENTFCVVKTNKPRGSAKVLKSARQPLTDKTNSGSDEASTLPCEKHSQNVATKEVKSECQPHVERLKRARRAPTRFKENNNLKNVLNTYHLKPKQESSDIKISTKESKVSASVLNISQVAEKPQVPKSTYFVKKKPPVSKPFVQKTSVCNQVESCESDLVQNRPKRICRLPTKLQDHSISPNKYIPIQPINASTPLATKTKKSSCEGVKENVSFTQNIAPVKLPTKKHPPEKKESNNDLKSKTADSNNNAKQIDKKSIPPDISPRKLLRTKSTVKKLFNRSNSPQLLSNNKKQNKRDASGLDVYEFTYDPEQEPPPAKKKKKKPAHKHPKPKTVAIKSNYDKNLAKALAALKNTVASKLSNSEALKLNKDIYTKESVDNNCINLATQGQNQQILPENNVQKEKNYVSVRVEDIVNDIEEHPIDYSPVNSPSAPKSPIFPAKESSGKADPLNLQDDLSFFDEIPVASSSMNVSVKHPLASPWRAEFSDLPIKWQVNTYVKPNMTPAIESAFINISDSNRKKHVYTNLVSECNDPLPHVIENTNSFKQTSIMSFIKEVVDKSANKTKRVKLTPAKANSLFEDLTSNSLAHHTTQNKQTPLKSIANVNITSHIDKQYENSISHEMQHSNITDKENSRENFVTQKGMNKNTDQNKTYFGFDDTEDQENISPVKKNQNARSLRSRSRGILKEINEFKGPTRAVITVAAKSKPAQSSVNQIYEGVKAATEPSVFPEVPITRNPEVTNVQETCIENIDDTDSQSVHLFEDIECLHHHKVSRKSYGKTKKVTIRKKSLEASDDNSLSDIDRASVVSMEDLDDLSFKLPSEELKKKVKRRKPKKQMSKKEAKEVEEWAAGFNSMCEDIDGFDLVVE